MPVFLILTSMLATSLGTPVVLAQDGPTISLRCDATFITPKKTQKGPINIKVSKEGRWLELGNLRFSRTESKIANKWRFDTAGHPMFDFVDFDPKSMLLITGNQQTPLAITGYCSPITNPFEN